MIDSLAPEGRLGGWQSDYEISGIFRAGRRAGRGEEELFPALIESMAGSDPVCLRELTESLRADHRALEMAWHRVRDVLEKVARGESARLESDDVEALASQYERHIEREETELLPMAARLLSAEDLGRISRAMLERRGVGDTHGT